MKTSLLSLVLTLAPLGAASAQPVPPPAPVPPNVGISVTDTYAAKFICGVQPNTALNVVHDAQAGRYSTKINVHNNSGMTVTFRKKVIRLSGGERPIGPAERKPVERLEPDWAMEVVCKDIYNLLSIPTGKEPPPYVEGFVILEVFWPILQTRPPVDPFDVIGVYTYKGDLPGVPMASGVSIEVVPYPVKRNAHSL